MAYNERTLKTAEEMLKEARVVLAAYPDDKKMRDPMDGRRMLTKAEALKRFDGEDDFAAKVTSKLFGLKFDLFLRKGKPKRG